MKYIDLPLAVYQAHRTLDHLGLSEKAWELSVALELVAELQKASCPILGGDVYMVLDDELEPNYENWFIERLHGESDKEYGERSGQVTRDYLMQLSKRENQLWVTFVLLEGVELVGV